MNSMNRRNILSFLGAIPVFFGLGKSAWAEPKDDGWLEFKAYMTEDRLWMLGYIIEKIKQAKTDEEKNRGLETLSIVIGSACLDHDLDSGSDKQGLDGCYPNIQFKYKG